MLDLNFAYVKNSVRELVLHGFDKSGLIGIQNKSETHK